MKTVIFSPAITLLNRLSYTRKFSLLWLLSMIAVGVVIYSLFVSLDRIIQPSQRELEGIVLIKPISRATQALQLHRGISTALLNGDSKIIRNKHAAQEMEATAAFKAMEEKLPASLASGKNFRLIKANWERLRKEGLSLSAADNFTAHTLLIEQLLLFETFVADEYMLTLDPELPTFYLIDTVINKLPHTLEHLGRIRAYGTGILAREQSSKQQKTDSENREIDLRVRISELDNTLWVLDANLDKAIRYNPEIREPLHEISGNIATSAHVITKLVKSDLLTGRLSTSFDAFLETATTAIDAVYMQTHDALLPTIESLIEARIARTKQTLLMSTGIAMVAFLLVVYLSVGMYYAVIGSIQSLARAARAFATGDLDTRIRLDARDELSWVGDSFNQMADGFSAMLETHREDEARLRATLETAMDAVVQMDSKGIIIGWTSQAGKIFGWSSEEALGRALHETIIPPRYRAAHVKGLEHFLLSGEGPVLSSRIEITGLHRDGHEFPVELSIAPIRTAQGYEFSAFIRDITERKLAQTELQYRQDLLNEAQQLGQLGSWELNLVSSELRWSDEVYRIFELDPARFSPSYENFLNVVHPDDRDRVNQAYIQSLENRQPYDIVHRLLFADGRVKWARERCSSEFDASGKPLRSVGAVQDITEQYLAAEQLRIAAIAFETQTAIVITDPTPKILRVNKAFEEITGYTAAEAIGQDPKILSAPEIREGKAFYEKMWADLLGKGKWSGEIRDKSKSGRIYSKWLTITAVKAPDGSITHYVGTFFDITELKQYEEQLENASSELMKANAQIEEERARLAERVMERTAQLLYANLAKDSFLATMSHEIRTPLGGLLGMMELIGLSRLDGKQREMLQAARNSGESLLRIVDDILDWSKIEAGKLELTPQVASIPEMLRKVTSIYSPLASAKGIALRQRVDSKLGAAYLFDPLRLSQILNNFASNAVKFTERGTVEISAERVAQSDGKEEIRFCVRDTGIGMDEKLQARLFRHYEQASADTARMYGGTGLGLAICRSLAELMEGRIGVESTPGLGSTFCLTVSLPVASPAQQRDLQLRQAKEADEELPDVTPLLKDGKRVSVLLVDDHPVNRMLLKQQLEMLGVDAKAVESGAAALALRSFGRFDLMISDCHMPEMDGYELTRSIREMEQHDGRQRMPVIAWTANVLADEEQRCQAAGMDDILTKPTELADLRAMLLKWLAKTEIPAIAAPPPGASAKEAARNQAAVDTPIDFNVLSKIAKSHAAQAEMLQEFNLHNRSDIANLKAALKDGDPAAVARSAHRIRGASRMVGALELDRICTAIQQAAKQGDLNGARKAADKALDETVGRIEAAVSAFIAVP